MFGDEENCHCLSFLSFPLAQPEFDQAETKTVGFENRSGAYIRYVSTGSGETGRLQAGFIEIP